MTRADANEQIRDAVQLVINAVENWISKTDNTNKVFVNFKSEDQILLLRLSSWSKRLFLPMYEILDIQVPYYRSQLAHPRRKGTLGVSLKSLLSQKSLEYLEYEIAERYPEDEHIRFWFDREKQVQLLRERELKYKGARMADPDDFIEAPSVEMWVKDYNETLADEVKEFSELENRKHKPYRLSPWVK